MIGCDVRCMKEETMRILGNEEIIRINQDRGCRQPVKLIGTWTGEDILLYSKQLENGDLAIGMFNLSEEKGVARLNLDEVGLPYSTGKTLELKELWSGETYVVKNAVISCELEPCDCMVFRGKVTDL